VRRKTRNEQRARIRVGDRVSFSVGLYRVEAEVIEDRGHIGVNGRHFVAVRYIDDDGTVHRHDWPADEMRLVRRPRATRRS
jgi:hypothetical protein